MSMLVPFVKIVTLVSWQFRGASLDVDDRCLEVLYNLDSSLGMLRSEVASPPSSLVWRRFISNK